MVDIAQTLPCRYFTTLEDPNGCIGIDFNETGANNLPKFKNNEGMKFIQFLIVYFDSLMDLIMGSQESDCVQT